jgi:hypothetical protein
MARGLWSGRCRGISGAGFDFSLPTASERTERLRAVLHVLYLIFNEGYTATAGASLTVPVLSDEAIRLTRWLHRLSPDDGDVTGLLALMLRMTRHHRLLATRAHMHELAGHTGAAAADYLDTARHATSLPERRYLALQAARLTKAQPAGDTAAACFVRFKDFFVPNGVLVPRTAAPGSSV